MQQAVLHKLLVRRHKLRLTLPFVIFLFLAANKAFAQPPVRVSASSLPLQPPPYSSIGFVSQGPVYGQPTQMVRGRYHRLVMLNPAIAYEHPTLRIETLTYGDEGCCHRMVSVRELPLERLSQEGIRLPEATSSEFQFRRWLGPQSAEFRYGTLKCQLSNLNQSTILVACKE